MVGQSYGRDEKHVPSWFVEKALASDSSAARQAAYEAVDADVFAVLARDILAGHQYASVGDSGKNTACVYEVALGAGLGLSLYLSTLLPYAAVIVSKAGEGLVEFATEPKNGYERVVLSTRDVGFCVLSEADCRRHTSLRGAPADELLTVWDCLFETDLEPPWEWSDIQ